MGELLLVVFTLSLRILGPSLEGVEPSITRVCTLIVPSKPLFLRVRILRVVFFFGCWQELRDLNTTTMSHLCHSFPRRSMGLPYYADQLGWFRGSM